MYAPSFSLPVCYYYPVKAGWGDWAKPGEGQLISQKILNNRDRLLAQVNSENSAKVAARKDSAAKLLNVVISERRIKTASKYKVADIPHPFTSREEYERSLQMPLGGEVSGVRSASQPTAAYICECAWVYVLYDIYICACAHCAPFAMLSSVCFKAYAY